jgi:multiple sugar transport system substrate-binding protein/putative aldouronate transport system substrate-binding protein
MKRIVSILLAVMMTAGAASFALAGEADARDELAFGKFPEPVEVHIGASVDATDQTLVDNDTVDNNVYTRYLLENFNIKTVVDWTASGQDFNQKLALSIAGNSLPDGVVAPDRTYFLAAAKADMLYDLTNVFGAYASQAILDTHASTNGRAVQISSIDGKLMSMPNTSVATDGVIVMFIRQDWLDQLGLEVPKTVAEIGEVARAFKEANLGAGGTTIPILGTDKNGRVYHNYLNSANNTGVFDPIFQAFDAYPGYWYENAEGNVEYGTISPNTKQALSVLAQWYAEGLIDPEFATRDHLADPINGGTCGIFFGPWWAMGYGYADIWKNTPDADWQGYAVYTEDGQWNTHMKEVGNTYTLVNKNVSEDVAVAIVRMANVYKRDEALLTNQTTEAISWYPLRNVMAPGDECEYEYEELWKVLKGETIAEDYNIPGSMYPLMYADALCVNDVISYDGQEDLHIKDFDITNVNFNRMYALLVGDKPWATGKADKELYSITYSNTDKMTRYWSNLEALEDETIRMIITGKKPVDEFDAFVDQWLAEGGQAMIDEVATLQ